MNTFEHPGVTGYLLKTALLYSQVQLYHLIKWHLWNHRHPDRAEEALGRLAEILLIELPDENATLQTKFPCPCERYLYLNEKYRHEVDFVECIFRKFPGLMLMNERQMAEAAKQVEKELGRELPDLT